jgi:thimet oligopeptidase
LNSLIVELGELHRAVSLMRSVHPQAEVRKAAEECEQDIARFESEMSLHRPLFDAVHSCDLSGLDAKGQRMHQRLLRDFRRAGVDRDEDTRRTIQALRDALVAFSQDFSRNILGDRRSIQLDGPAELDGLPDDYVKRHPPGPDGMVTLSTDYPDYNPFMVYARSGRRREQLYRAFRSRGHPGNVRVLKALLAKRHELATLLEYRHWADYVTEDKMIKTADAVSTFIERVSRVAERRSAVEYDLLLERKRKDVPGAAEVMDWEKGYYEERVRAESFEIDSREIRPYLPFDAVKSGVLSVVSELFGFEFHPSPAVPRWHEEVEVLDVFERGARVGRVYLDMHPREGKFKHAAMFPLVHGIRGERLPEAVLVCNFPSPRVAGADALLEHDDVVTLFHEIGHLLHHLFARDHEWVEFSGTGAEWDFVEVPSQLMEEWAWDANVLGRFARHHVTGEKIPAGLVERMRRAKDFGLGLQVRQQMFYATLSLRCHNSDPTDLDVGALEEEIQNRYSRFRFVEDTHFHASFGHLDSYSAVYYTYMWSLVIEKDLLGAFKTPGLMDRATAERYRRCILEPGGSEDAADLVRSFLGREFGFDAFERWLDGD